MIGIMIVSVIVIMIRGVSIFYCASFLGSFRTIVLRVI